MSLSPAQRAQLKARGYSDQEIDAAYGGAPAMAGVSSEASSTAPLAPMAGVSGGAGSTAKTAISLDQYQMLREKGHDDAEIQQHYAPPAAEVAAFNRAGGYHIGSDGISDGSPETSGGINQVARGFFRGGSDELNAAAGTVKDLLPEAIGGAPGVSLLHPSTIGPAYRGRQAGEEAGLHQYAAAHPKEALAEQIGGGLLESAVETAVTGGAAAPEALSMGARIFHGGVAGGKFAAQYGFLDTHGGLKERTAAAANAVPYGVATGMLLPPAIDAAKWGAKTAGRAAGITTEGGRLSTYSDAVDQALEQTGQTSADVEARHGALMTRGKGAPTILETLGPAGTQVLNDLAALPKSSPVRAQAFQTLQRLKADPQSAELATALQGALARKPTKLQLWQRSGPAGVAGYAVGGPPGAAIGSMGTIAVQAGLRHSGQREAETALERLLRPSETLFDTVAPTALETVASPYVKGKSSLPTISTRTGGGWDTPPATAPAPVPPEAPPPSASMELPSAVPPRSAQTPAQSLIQSLRPRAQAASAATATELIGRPTLGQQVGERLGGESTFQNGAARKQYGASQAAKGKGTREGLDASARAIGLDPDQIRATASATGERQDYGNYMKKHSQGSALRRGQLELDTRQNQAAKAAMDDLQRRASETTDEPTQEALYAEWRHLKDQYGRARLAALVAAGLLSGGILAGSTAQGRPSSP